MKQNKKEFQQGAFEGFSKLNKKERLKILLDCGFLDEEDLSTLNRKTLYPTDLAEKFIENVIGYFQMPLGVVPHLVIDGKSFVVPMAIEETSIVAAASKTAKWVKNKGEIRTKILGRISIGQIQVSRLKHKNSFSKKILKEKEALIEETNQKVTESLVQRGGGVKDIQLRFIPRGDGDEMGVLHVHVDCCDAMGANLVNQVCEHLKSKIEKLTEERVSLCILSNLSDQRLVRAELLLRDIEAELVEKIEEASLFAELDPYRACTHNKGVLNAIDALLLATGNDWRAVEAGIHAYAATGLSSLEKNEMKPTNQGGYFPITQWREWSSEPQLKKHENFNSKNGSTSKKRNSTRIMNKTQSLNTPKLFGWKEEEKLKRTSIQKNGQLKIKSLERDNLGIQNKNNKIIKKTKNLIGVFEAPLSLGIVGGVTRLHPIAALSLKMLKVKTSDDLARVCAAIGLVQNLGALSALTTVGIIEGHMKLHIKNLSLGAGAKKKEISYVQKKLEEILALKQPIRLSHAVEVLQELRQKKARTL